MKASESIETPMYKYKRSLVCSFFVCYKRRLIELLRSAFSRKEEVLSSFRRAPCGSASCPSSMPAPSLRQTSPEPPKVHLLVQPQSIKLLQPQIFIKNVKIERIYPKVRVNRPIPSNFCSPIRNFCREYTENDAHK